MLCLAVWLELCLKLWLVLLVRSVVRAVSAVVLGTGWKDG